MFTWTAIDFATMKPLSLPNETTMSDVFDLSIISTDRGRILDITCTATIPGYSNIGPGITRVFLNVEGICLTTTNIIFVIILQF